MPRPEAQTKSQHPLHGLHISVQRCIALCKNIYTSRVLKFYYGSGQQVSFLQQLQGFIPCPDSAQTGGFYA